MQTPTDILRQAVEMAQADSGVGARKLERQIGLPLWSLRGILDPDRRQSPSVDRAAEIANALGLEFYVGPPRPRPDLYPGARGTDPGGIPAEKLRDLESSARTLNRVVVDAGGDPIPPDLRAAPERGGDQAEGPGFDYDINIHPLAWDVRAAAGSGALVFDEVAEYRIAIPRSSLPSWARRRELICIRATGDSMTPTLPLDSVLALDSSSIEPLDEEIFVIATDDGLVVKRLREDDGWWLVSDNPEYPPCRTCESDRMIGRVAWFGALR